MGVRPPLSKKIGSCQPGGQIKSQSGGRESFFFFSPNFMFYKQGGGGVVKKYFLFLKIGKKKSSSRPFLAHPVGGQETIFYLRMALKMTRKGHFDLYIM